MSHSQHLCHAGVCVLQGQNELWLALVLSHPTVIGLTGPELAGLLGAILTGEVLRRSGAVWTAYPASPRVGAGLKRLHASCFTVCDLFCFVPSAF